MAMPILLMPFLSWWCQPEPGGISWRRIAQGDGVRFGRRLVQIAGGFAAL